MRALCFVVLSACGSAPRATTPAAPLPPIATAASAAPASPCALANATELADGDTGALLGSRIAAAGDVALAEWERQGTDETEGWSGAKPHFALVDASGARQAPVSVSSAVAAPNAVAAPLGGRALGSLVYGAHIDWFFSLATFATFPESSGFFEPRGARYEPPSYVPNTMEAASADGSPLLAVAITTGHDLGGKRVDDCMETATGVPPCHSQLWGAADELAVIGFPKGGAPWTRPIPLPAAATKDTDWPLAIALDEAHGAYAFRYAGAMWLGWLGASAADVGAPTKIREGRLGAPAMAMRGGELLVVFAERDTDDAPWHLVSMRFDARHAAGPVRTLERGFAPSLAATTDGFVIAWMDGDAKSTGWIRAASWDGAGSLAAAPALTPTSGNARDPEVAASGARAWIVWQEFSRARRDGAVHLASLVCPR